MVGLLILIDYQTLVEQAREQIIVLLTTEWLVADSERSRGDRRTRELTRIRQIYIPELIIRLHAMLYTSRTRIPEFVSLPCVPPMFLLTVILLIEI